ncbi:MAG: hypothetical protein HXY18_02130 [Bryobacteraceae bacterium]|nr:hypothetical protein [Bryobacteraceae bacterium]
MLRSDIAAWRGLRRSTAMRHAGWGGSLPASFRAVSSLVLLRLGNRLYPGELHAESGTHEQLRRGNPRWMPEADLTALLAASPAGQRVERQLRRGAVIADRA